MPDAALRDLDALVDGEPSVAIARARERLAAGAAVDEQHRQPVEHGHAGEQGVVALERVGRVGADGDDVRAGGLEGVGEQDLSRFVGAQRDLRGGALSPVDTEIDPQVGVVGIAVIL